jgi:O-antigen/teichoic acid export membrane protein
MLGELSRDLEPNLRRGTVWVGAASVLSGTLDLVSTLACLWLWVSPEELGVATLAAAMFPVLERVATMGLSAAAVRRGGDDRALSSVVWLAVGAASVVLVGALAAAPAIGRAFGQPIVGTLVCLYAVKLVAQTTYLVPDALLRRDLAFATLSKIRIAAVLADTAAKLATAYLGAHGYPPLRIACFAVGPLAAAAVTAFGAQLARPWRPIIAFDAREAIAAAKFGITVSLSDLLYFAYTSADYLVIGAVFGPAAVGAYRLAYEMVLDVVRLVSMVTAEVAFPTFARLKDAARAGEHLVAFTRRNLVLVAPALVVIGTCADDLLAILYPPLGADAATAVRILCIVGALRSASFVLPAMLSGLGYARDALVYNIVAAVICPTAFAIAALAFPQLGYLSVAWAWAIAYPIAFAILLGYALKRTQLSIFEYGAYLAPVANWAVGATLLSIIARIFLPEEPHLRAAGVAAVVAAYYVPLFRATRAR